MFTFSSPVWIRSQKKVYDYMYCECSICMQRVHHLDIAKQHNSKHPDICKECLQKSFTCPFCRLSLSRVVFKIRSPPSLHPFPLIRMNHFE